MGYKCDCGRFFTNLMNPLPATCSRCGKPIPGGCLEGDSYRIITEKPSQLVHVFTKIGGILTKQPNVVDRVQLAPGCFVEFLDDWDDRDTGNVPKIKR